MTLLKGGEYKLGELIDKGGFGEVFLGTRVKSQFETTVAIKKCKLLKKTETSKTPDPRLEAQILKDLSTFPEANYVIAEYHDSFEEDGYFYLVMEYCKHGSIYDYILKKRQRPFNEDHTRDILLQVLSALEFIHKAGYVHRDLSPKNILIHSFSEDSVPRVKLVDFGLSKKAHLIKNTVAGTPGFFNAELMKEGYRKEVDFYAFGCLAFFMLTSQLISTREAKLTDSQVEEKMKSQSLSKESRDLVFFLRNSRVDCSMDIKLKPFFSSEYIKAAQIQASSIRQSQSNAYPTTDRHDRKPFREVQNTQEESRERRPEKQQARHQKLPVRGPAQAYNSLPTKLTARHASRLSVASSNSPVSWPLPKEFRYIAKNVMVTKFGRAIFRGPDRLFICETLNYDDKCKCTYVGHLRNACCPMKQELLLFKPLELFELPDFNTLPDGIPESKLKLIRQIRSQFELERSDFKGAQAMYKKMRSILRAVCDQVRKREENPCLLVDTMAKVTWGGTITVDLSNKQSIKWHCKDSGPPNKECANLSQEYIEMLDYVHKDFSQLFSYQSLILKKV